MFIIKIFYFWAKNKVNTVNVNMLNQTKIIAKYCLDIKILYEYQIYFQDIYIINENIYFLKIKYPKRKPCPVPYNVLATYTVPYHKTGRVANPPVIGGSLPLFRNINIFPTIYSILL